MKKKNLEIGKKILEKIEKAKKIIINVHRNPDLDTVGSSTALAQVLERLGKKVELICPDKLPPEFLFLKKTQKIRTVDYTQFKFSDDDLFIVLDSASNYIITGSKTVIPKKNPNVVIDHHEINSLKGEVRLINKKASATAEILFDIFHVWGIEFNEGIATSLLSGIMGDTVFLRYSDNPKKIFSIVNTLINLGADYQKIIFNVLDNNSFPFVKLLGIFLDKAKIYDNGRIKFIFSAISYGEYKKMGMPLGVRETVADVYFRSIKGVDFGIVALEEEKNKICLSFRSKNTDVAKLARRFGGGGHLHAAGATVTGDYREKIKEIPKQIIKKKAHPLKSNM